MPYFLYGRRNEYHESSDTGHDGYGGGSQSDYRERDITP